jgi:DNA-repair protein XRCC3
MDDFGLPPKVLHALQKLATTTSITSVLEMSVPGLVKTTKLSENEVKMLQKAVSERAVRPRFVTAYDLYLNHRKLSLGCPILDQHLDGGILSEGVTEIFGESACGKTQFCLQLCLTVQLPFKLGGLEGGAVYICTEDKFPAKRLEQMKPQFQQQYQECLNDTNVGDNIYIKHVVDVKGLFDILDDKIPALMKHAKVRLVVIDSIAALVRVEYSMNEMNERAQVLHRIGARLAQLSHRNNMPVVCVNQVNMLRYCAYSFWTLMYSGALFWL